MCTLETRGNIFLLTLTGNTEHWLNPTLISEIRSLLAQIRLKATPGSVLVTTSQGNFFCNGFDLAWAQSQGQSHLVHRIRQVSLDFEHLITDLYSLPLPTIAAVTGHVAAAGVMLVMSHDYILMRKDKGVMYMTEVDIGMSIPDQFMALLRRKLGLNLRDVVLGGVKMKAEEGVKRGVFDSAHDGVEKTMEAALRLGEKLGERKWNGEVYSEIRKSAFGDVLPVVGLVRKEIMVARL